MLQAFVVGMAYIRRIYSPVLIYFADKRLQRKSSFVPLSPRPGNLLVSDIAGAYIDVCPSVCFLSPSIYVRLFTLYVRSTVSFSVSFSPCLFAFIFCLYFNHFNPFHSLFSLFLMLSRQQLTRTSVSSPNTFNVTAFVFQANEQPFVALFSPDSLCPHLVMYDKKLKVNGEKL